MTRLTASISSWPTSYMGALPCRGRRRFVLASCGVQQIRRKGRENGAPIQDRPRRAGRMGQIHRRQRRRASAIGPAWLVEPRAEAAADLAGRLDCEITTCRMPSPIGGGGRDRRQLHRHHLDLTLARCGPGRRCSARSRWNLDLRAAAGTTRPSCGWRRRRCSSAFQPPVRSALPGAEGEAGRCAWGRSKPSTSSATTPRRPHAGFVKPAAASSATWRSTDLDMARWLLGEAPSECSPRPAASSIRHRRGGGRRSPPGSVLKTPSGRAMIATAAAAATATTSGSRRFGHAEWPRSQRRSRARSRRGVRRRGVGTVSSRSPNATPGAYARRWTTSRRR